MSFGSHQAPPISSLLDHTIKHIYRYTNILVTTPRTAPLKGGVNGPLTPQRERLVALPFPSPLLSSSSSLLPHQGLMWNLIALEWHTKPPPMGTLPAPNQQKTLVSDASRPSARPSVLQSEGAGSGICSAAGCTNCTPDRHLEEALRPSQGFLLFFPS